MQDEWQLFEQEGGGVREADAGADAAVYLTFDLAGQTLAVPVANVREIIDRQVITPIPGAPSEIAGVVDVRGASVPIVDLDRRLGLAARESDADARTVIFDFNDAPIPFVVGMNADRVRSVFAISESVIEAFSGAAIGFCEPRMLKGIYRDNDRMVILIDPKEVFDAQDGEASLSAASELVA